MSKTRSGNESETGAVPIPNNGGAQTEITVLDSEGVRFFRRTFGRSRVYLDTGSDPAGTTVHYLELHGNTMHEVIG